jgi:hypothetical protein
MSRDKRGNGIQEVDGSIPFGSTNSKSIHLIYLSVISVTKSPIGRV